MKNVRSENQATGAWAGHVSCDLKPGENILIESIGGNEDLTRALIKEVYAAGGNPFLWLSDKAFDRELLLGCNVEQLKKRAGVGRAVMASMDAYIGVRGGATAARWPTCRPKR